MHTLLRVHHGPTTQNGSRIADVAPTISSRVNAIVSTPEGGYEKQKFILSTLYGYATHLRLYGRSIGADQRNKILLQIDHLIAHALHLIDETNIPKDKVKTIDILWCTLLDQKGNMPVYIAYLESIIKLIDSTMAEAYPGFHYKLDQEDLNAQLLCI